VPASKHKSRWISDRDVRNRLHYFLGRRCSREFLRLYIEKHPDILESVAEPGLFLSAMSEVQLAARFHELGLFPEDMRKTFVTTVSNYAIAGEDLYVFESATIRGLFTEEEFTDLRERVREELLPRLADVRQNWESYHPYSESSEEHMQPLIDSLRALGREFADNPEVVCAVERQIELANTWIEEHTDEDSNEMPPRDRFDFVQAPDAGAGARSIFDDVDD